MPPRTSRKIISNNAHRRSYDRFRRVSRGSSRSAAEVRAGSRSLSRAHTCAPAVLAVRTPLVSRYIRARARARGSMINRDRTIRATGGGWYVRTYVRTGQPCRIKLSKATSGLRPPDRTGQKRRSHPVIAKGLRRAIPSRRAIRRASRRSFRAIFFSPLCFSFFPPSIPPPLSLSLALALRSSSSSFFLFALRPSPGVRG